jgi:hypothetical protein
MTARDICRGLRLMTWADWAFCAGFSLVVTGLFWGAWELVS